MFGHRRGFLFLVCTLCGLGLLLLSQLHGEDEVRPFISVLRAEAKPPRGVEVLLSVLDQSGRPMRQFRPDSFVLNLGDQKAQSLEVRLVGESGRPISVVLAIDVSGSMKGEPIQAAKEAARFFVNQLGRDDFCALMSFGAGVNSLVDFTRDRKRISDGLDSLQAEENRTALNQAIYNAVDLAAAASTDQVAVVVLTDGKDTGKGVTSDDVMRKVERLGQPVYTLGFGPDADMSFLNRVASIKGGASFHTPDPQELRGLYELVLEKLKDRYLITASFPELSGGVYDLAISLKHRGEAIPASGTHPLRFEGDKQEAGPPWMIVLCLIGAIGFGVIIIIYQLHKRGSDATEPPKPEPTERPRSEPTETPASEPKATASQPEAPHAPSPPDVYLFVSKGVDSGTTFALTSRDVIIGRDEAKCDLVLNDPRVGRLHARISVDDNARYVIKEIKGEGGAPHDIYIDRKKIDTEVTLQSGDRIYMGQTALVFQDNRT